MSNKRNMMDIRELLVHIRARSSNRQIEKDLHIDRRTVGRHRAWANGQACWKAPCPPWENWWPCWNRQCQFIPPQNVSTVESYREVVTQLIEEGVEIAAIWERLKERGYLRLFHQ